MPLRSMTGFGASERTWDGHGKVSVELRSVNSRFLEVKVRQPHGAAAEHSIRETVKSRLGRGRVDVSVNLRLDPGLRELQSVSSLLETLREIEGAAVKAGIELSPPNSLELLRFAGSARGGDSQEERPDFLAEMVEEALEALCSMREREGTALCENLEQLLEELESKVAAITAGLEPESSRIEQRVRDRIETTLAGLGQGDSSPDPQRLAQEVAILIARADVAEELSRIASHLAQARELLSGPAQTGQGKTLDFLSQELMRELTTTGSKISSHDASKWVIEAKGTVERIREQAQNAE